MNANSNIIVRPARIDDAAEIQDLIAKSSRSLGTCYYTCELIEIALQTVLGLDTQLVQDGTYFVAESGGVIVGCGGWSRRRTLFGSDDVRGRDDALLDPAEDSAKIRAFFIHPGFARRGVGSRILELCEQEAVKAGFHSLELGATLSGADFYLSRGYVAGPPYDYECAPGMHMEIVPMSKELEG